MGFEINTDPGRLLQGGVSGLAAGIVYGILLQFMGLMTVIAVLVGSDLLVLGWFSHLVIAWVFGIAFAFFIRATSIPSGVVYGLAYGAVLWVGGGLAGFHGLLDVPFALNAQTFLLAVGHLLYGAVLGLAYGALQTGAGTRLARRARPA